MNDEILPAKMPETLEEEFIEEFCQCGHIMKKGKDNEHWQDQECMALISRGGCWTSCDCKRARAAIFEFVFYSDELAA